MHDRHQDAPGGLPATVAGTYSPPHVALIRANRQSVRHFPQPFDFDGDAVVIGNGEIPIGLGLRHLPFRRLSPGPLLRQQN